MRPLSDDNLEYVIHQSLPCLSGRQAQPLTVRAIIDQLNKRVTQLCVKERAFLADFSCAEDQGSFIEGEFLRAAIDAGKTVRRERYQPGGEPGGWFAISCFFGLYAIHFIQYGEGRKDYGPFGERTTADVVFDAVVALNTPG